MPRKPKIMLVMHEVPYNSGFLAAKYIWLSEVFDTHLLSWNKKSEKFITKYQLPTSFRKKMHAGVVDTTTLLQSLFTLLWVVLFKKKVRQFVFGEGTVVRNLKIIASYLPVFTVEPDIIHFEFGTIATDIKTIKTLTGSKISVSFRGYDINYIGLDNPAYYNDVWQYADGFHFLGNDLKNRAIKRGYKAGKVEVLIPPAIDTSFFTPEEVPNKENNKLIIVSAGRLVWKKGYEYGIRACATLKEKGIPFEYRIIGNGDFKQAIQFTISELGLENDVKLLGAMVPQELRKELSQAHVFLHPAISEGFCNAVIEAQAMGVPVICSAADGLSENIVDGKTGFVTPVWDVSAMAEILQWFWHNKEQIKIMGNAGVQRVKEHFKIEDQIKAFTAFYNTLYEQSK